MPIRCSARRHGRPIVACRPSSVPRPASGGLYVSLTNNGPLPVTIESASLNPPYAQGPVDRQAQPLRGTGAATYWPQAGFGSGPGTRLAGSVLRPGQVIVVRLPVTTGGCWMPAHGYAVLFTFWVRLRFWRWTHLVQIWWGSPFNQDAGAIIAHEPGPASQGGMWPRQSAGTTARPCACEGDDGAGCPIMASRPRDQTVDRA
jgi:hypothetical protein